MSGIGSGAAAFVGAAAPGIAQGVSGAVDSYQDYKKDQALDASTAAQTGGPQTGIADANHPVWGILNNLTGNPGNAPLPGGGALAPSPVPTPDLSAQMPAMPAAGVPAGGAAPQQLQNGGVVRANYGKPTIAPSFERGPALPVGPNNTVVGTPSPRMGMLSMENGGPVPGNEPTRESQGLGQGITPAGTEGQILTMDAGGVVPQGFVQQPGITGVPMNGRGAAFVEGVQAGQNIGRNIYQAWQEHQANEATGQAAKQSVSADVNNPDQTDHPQGFLGKAKDAVEGFFHHLNEGTPDDDGKPRTPAPGSPNAPPIPAPGAAPAGGPALPPPTGAAPAGAAPTPPPSPVPSVPGAPAPGGAGAAGAPGQPPPGIAAPPAGGAPAAAPPGGQPGAAPNVPAQPQAGQPQPVSPLQGALTQDVTKAVAANPQVKAGIPDKSPTESGLPHSLTPEWYRKNNELLQQAVYHAAKAGEDPAKVYESLTAMRNAHFQGQILKQLGTANVAFQNGDMDSVKKALSNVNYYLPNGQGITFKTASPQDAAADPSVKPGDLMYKNPFYGMYGHEHDPEYTKIDSQHIQSLGAAALDPRAVQEAQLKSYSAQMEARNNATKAQGEYLTGQGRQFTGLAAVQNAGTKQAMMDVDRRLKIAAGNKDQAEANWYNVRQPGAGNSGQPKVTIPAITALQKQVSDSVDRNVNGLPGFVDPYETDAQGNRTLSLSPVAGKTVPNPSRIPSYLTNGVDKTGKPMPLSPDQQQNVKVLGGQIAAANAGIPGMTVDKAVELGARITHQEQNSTTHPDPKTGKPMKDFVYDPDRGTAHIWVGNAYENVYLRPNVADMGGEGGSQETPPPGGNSAGAAGGEEGSPGPDAFQ